MISGMAKEYTTIVLHIAADRAAEFETLFERDELKRWDDYTARGRFLEARLIKCEVSTLQAAGIQDYVLQIVLADHAAHSEHDADKGFEAYNAKADQLQPEEPAVTFGTVVFERLAKTST